MKLTKNIFFVSLLLLAQQSFAQVDTIRTKDIEVIKEYTPYLEEGKKQKFTPTMPAVTPASREQLQYNIAPEFIQTQYEPDAVKPLPIEMRESNNERMLYVKAGYGNKSNPLAQFAIAKAEKYDYSIGLLGDYMAVSGNEFDQQKMGATKIKAFGTKEIIGATIGADVHYNNFRNDLYGFDRTLFAEDANVEQSYSVVGASANVHSIPEDDFAFRYNVFADVDALSSKSYNNKESQAKIGAILQQQIFDAIDAELQASIGFRSTTIEQADDKLNETVFNVTPLIRPELGNIEAELGASINKDKHNGFALFPHVGLQAPLPNSSFTLFAGWKGETVMNGLLQTIEVNPLITPDAQPQNYTQQILTPLGLKGSINENFAINASIKNTLTKNAPLFADMQESTTDVYTNGGFDILKEEKLSDWSPNVSLNYQYGENVNAVANLGYHFYGTTTYENAFHLPKLDAGLQLGVQPFDQFEVNAGFKTLSGIKTFSGENLNTIFNANVGAEYKLNDQFGIFLDVNNLTNQNYERWKNYPSVGMNILGGIVFSY